jgi:oxygen-independent coproporphyrinogen-3 oxidase
VSDVQYRHAYVHVPFCARRCSYCDFSIAVRRQVPSGAFADAVGQELTTRAIASQTLDTLYFGGGTPSRLGPDGVRWLLDSVRERLAWQHDAEVTLEANPEDITADAVRAWRDAGINRLSIGVQSFDDRVLQWMHRVHNANDARRAVAMARDGGLESFSLDLIFALPDALSRDWSRDVAEVIALDPDHVSMYGLTVESHTPLGRWRARGDVTESGEDVYESEFLAARALLRDAGFEHYEVSNYARPGKRAVHNSAYWRGVPYLGLGPSAHGFDGQTRRWNTSAFAAWTAQIAEGLDPREGEETLTADNRVAEAVYLGLRTIDGLSMSAAERESVRAWFDAGWLERVAATPDSRDSEQVRCTAMGWLRLDRLASDLTALRSRS